MTAARNVVEPFATGRLPNPVATGRLRTRAGQAFDRSLVAGARAAIINGISGMESPELADFGPG